MTQKVPGKSHRENISSMELRRDLGVTRESAWYLLYRLRKVLEDEGADLLFDGSVEADETGMESKEASKHNNKKFKAGYGSVGKVPMAGLRNRELNQAVGYEDLIRDNGLSSGALS